MKRTISVGLCSLALTFSMALPASATYRCTKTDVIEDRNDCIISCDTIKDYLNDCQTDYVFEVCFPESYWQCIPRPSDTDCNTQPNKPIKPENPCVPELPTETETPEAPAETETPETEAPETETPETETPETETPETETPETETPETETPETETPETETPETETPETETPETEAPETETPETETPDETEEKEEDNRFSAYAQEVLKLVNEQRAANGLSALTLNSELTVVAQAKAQDMRDNQYFSHTSPTYGSPFDMMKSFGITYRTAGENIAMGYATPASVVNGWMNSSGHRANILSASFTQMGIGYVSSGNYWCQMFIG